MVCALIQSAIASSMASLMVSPRVIASIRNLTHISRSTRYSVMVNRSRTVGDEPLEFVNRYPHLHGQDDESIFVLHLC